MTYPGACRDAGARGGGGGGALGYGLAIMCRTTQGSGGGGRDIKGEIGGGGDHPRKSIICGLHLLGLLFPCAYTVI